MKLLTDLIANPGIAFGIKLHHPVKSQIDGILGQSQFTRDGGFHRFITNWIHWAWGSQISWPWGSTTNRRCIAARSGHKLLEQGPQPCWRLALGHNPVHRLQVMVWVHPSWGIWMVDLGDNPVHPLKFPQLVVGDLLHHRDYCDRLHRKNHAGQYHPPFQDVHHPGHVPHHLLESSAWSSAFLPEM